MFRGASLPDEHTTPHEFYLQCTLLLCLFVQQVCKCKSFHVEIIVSNEYLIIKVQRPHGTCGAASILLRWSEHVCTEPRVVLVADGRRRL